jgi:hypothetical protein
MQWFCALVPAYPEVQKKAQAELDAVVGRDRLPTIDDEKDLPYCHAIIKEVERLHNPFWLGTPHVASEDFVYRGQYIPKSTVVVLNTWTMHHDPHRHSNPEKFDVSVKISVDAYGIFCSIVDRLQSPTVISMIVLRQLRVPMLRIQWSVTTGCLVRGEFLFRTTTLIDIDEYLVGASARECCSRSVRSG